MISARSAHALLYASQQLRLLDSGGTTETWLVSDGLVQAWAGYAMPAMAAPNGSTYQRVDGKEEKTTFYVHVGGAWMGMV